MFKKYEEFRPKKKVRPNLDQKKVRPNFDF